jgi:hypothetical protein
MSCHLSMNLMELVVALTTQLDFCHNSKKKMKTFFFTIGSRTQLFGCQHRDRSRAFSP